MPTEDLSFAAHPDLFTPADQADLVALARALFPHDRLGDGPYERVVNTIIDAAANDPSLLHILCDGLSALRGTATERPANVPSDQLASMLTAPESAVFFQALRRSVAWHLYDDHEVWEFIGYPGASFNAGGYLHRGFDDLDWLPTPRIEENDAPLPDIGPLSVNRPSLDQVRSAS